MVSNATGQNKHQAAHTLAEIIAGGVTLHLVDTAVVYTDGATEVSNKSVASATVAEAEITVTTPSTYAGVATLDMATDVVFDVSSATATVVEGVVQNQANPSRFVLTDETNDPDLSPLDEYKLVSGQTVYKMGNP